MRKLSKILLAFFAFTLIFASVGLFAFATDDEPTNSPLYLTKEDKSIVNYEYHDYSKNTMSSSYFKGLNEGKDIHTNNKFYSSNSKWAGYDLNNGYFHIYMLDGDVYTGNSQFKFITGSCTESAPSSTAYYFNSDEEISYKYTVLDFDYCAHLEAGKDEFSFSIVVGDFFDNSSGVIGKQTQQAFAYSAFSDYISDEVGVWQHFTIIRGVEYASCTASIVYHLYIDGIYVDTYTRTVATSGKTSLFSGSISMNATYSDCSVGIDNTSITHYSADYTSGEAHGIDDAYVEGKNQTKPLYLCVDAVYNYENYASVNPAASVGEISSLDSTTGQYMPAVKYFYEDTLLANIKNDDKITTYFDVLNFEPVNSVQNIVFISPNFSLSKNAEDYYKYHVNEQGHFVVSQKGTADKWPVEYRLAPDGAAINTYLLSSGEVPEDIHNSYALDFDNGKFIVVEKWYWDDPFDTTTDLVEFKGISEVTSLNGSSNYFDSEGNKNPIIVFPGVVTEINNPAYAITVENKSGVNELLSYSLDAINSANDVNFPTNTDSFTFSIYQDAVFYNGLNLASGRNILFNAHGNTVTGYQHLFYRSGDSDVRIKLVNSVIKDGNHDSELILEYGGLELTIGAGNVFHIDNFITDNVSVAPEVTLIPANISGDTRTFVCSSLLSDDEIVTVTWYYDAEKIYKSEKWVKNSDVYSPDSATLTDRTIFPALPGSNVWYDLVNPFEEITNPVTQDIDLHIDTNTVAPAFKNVTGIQYNISFKSNFAFNIYFPAYYYYSEDTGYTAVSEGEYATPADIGNFSFYEGTKPRDIIYVPVARDDQGNLIYRLAVTEDITMKQLYAASLQTTITYGVKSGDKMSTMSMNLDKITVKSYVTAVNSNYECGSSGKVEILAMLKYWLAVDDYASLLNKDDERVADLIVHYEELISTHSECQCAVKLGGYEKITQDDYDLIKDFEYDTLTHPLFLGSKIIIPTDSYVKLAFYLDSNVNSMTAKYKHSENGELKYITIEPKVHTGADFDNTSCKVAYLTPNMRDITDIFEITVETVTGEINTITYSIMEMHEDESSKNSADRDDKYIAVVTSMYAFSRAVEEYMKVE